MTRYYQNLETCLVLNFWINELATINNNKEFKNCLKEIYSEKLELKKEKENDNVTTFSGLNIPSKEGQLSTKLDDKRMDTIFA